MRKLIKSMPLLLLACGMVASCTENNLVEESGKNKITITASISNPDGSDETRTCIDVNGSPSGALGLLWQSGDKIGVFGNGGTSNALFASTSQGNVKQADFDGSMSAADEPYRAYYPYSTDNNGAQVHNLRGNVPEEQPYNPETGTLVADYKYGAPLYDNNRRFSFRHLFSMLRISIDASNTDLAGEKLQEIELNVTDAQGNERAINGSFTFSAVDGSWTNHTGGTGTIRMKWTTQPVLSTGTTHQGFITVMPTVMQGDKINVCIVTEMHKVTFTADCRLNFQSEHVYDIPLVLKNYKDNADKFGYQQVELPTMRSFGFNVTSNQGKLLDNKLTWNSSNQPQFDAVSSYAASIEGDAINLMIPYLYDFKLIPVFETSDGATVTVNGVVQESGKTQVDFSSPVVYTLTTGSETREYTVNITNTGLPVVVLEQSASGDFSAEKEGGFMGIGATTVNKFVDFMIRGKETEWVEDDEITIYNADGTVDVATALGGAKLRGNTTKSYPKKPMALKFAKKQSVLGLPAHKRWVLLANWLDHSMIRNAVSLDIAHTIENAWRNNGMAEGIPWNVHGKNVEFVIDGHHVGNYFLCEQIKIDGSRLDIQDPFEDVQNPTFETCGYLLEIDNNYDENYKFITSKYSVPFMFKDDVTDTGIFNAVKTKIQGIEDNISSGNYSEAYEDLDIYSAIDQWLIFELTMNREYVDPRSVYYFMDGDNKLKAGPVWDFDRATFQNTTTAATMKNQDQSRIKPYDKWICWTASPAAGKSESNLEDSKSAVWYPQLIKDSQFQQAVQERWQVLYPYLQGVVNNIREYGNTMALSYTVNNAMWPTTVEAINKHKSNFYDWSGDELIEDYADVIDNMAKVYEARLNGMNSLITSGKFTE